MGNKYKFQGQEHQDDLGLGWVQFKWRNHDPALGGFFNIDPLAEDYYYNSPYAFSENRVIDGIELEGLEWKSIKDEDTGITTRQLTVQMYNEAGLTDKQLTNAQNAMKNQFAESFSGEGGTAQLVIENVSEPKGDFVVTLKDAKSTIIKDADGNPIQKTYKGGKAGELGQTQKNSFDVTVETDGSKRSNSGISRSFSHEAGHTAGLRHPYDPKNTISDIKQGAPGVKTSTVRKNLMNSGANPTNPGTSGTELTSGQLKSIDKLIEEQQ